MPKKIYLANPYGFSAQQRDGPLRDLVRILQDMGAEVWEPFERNNPDDMSLRPGSAYRTGQADMRDVHDSDGILAVVN